MLFGRIALFFPGSKASYLGAVLRCFFLRFIAFRFRRGFGALLRRWRLFGLVWGLGFRVQGSGLMVQGSGFRAQGSSAVGRGGGTGH